MAAFLSRSQYVSIFFSNNISPRSAKCIDKRVNVNQLLLKIFNGGIILWLVAIVSNDNEYFSQIMFGIMCLITMDISVAIPA